MGKARADFARICLMGNHANREKYGGTDYFRIIGAMGGRATRGISKHHDVVTWKRTAADRGRKPAPLKRSGLENATMQEVLAELER